MIWQRYTRCLLKILPIERESFLRHGLARNPGAFDRLSLAVTPDMYDVMQQLRMRERNDQPVNTVKSLDTRQYSDGCKALELLEVLQFDSKLLYALWS